MIIHQISLKIKIQPNDNQSVQNDVDSPLNDNMNLPTYSLPYGWDAAELII